MCGCGYVVTTCACVCVRVRVCVYGVTRCVCVCVYGVTRCVCVCVLLPGGLCSSISAWYAGGGSSSISSNL